MEIIFIDRKNNLHVTKGGNWLIIFQVKMGLKMDKTRNYDKLNMF